MKPLVAIWFSVFTDLIAFTGVLPYFPSMIEATAQSNKDDALFNIMERFTAAVGVPQGHPLHYVLLGGIVGSTLSFGSFISGPYFGHLSDTTKRLGRRGVVLVLMGLSLIATAALTFVVPHEHFTLVMVTRFLVGIGKTNVSVAIAMVNDVAESDVTAQRRGVALIGIAYAIGFLCGPPLSVLAVRCLNIHYTVYVTCVEATAFVFTYLALPETRANLVAKAQNATKSIPVKVNDVASPRTHATANPLRLFSPRHNIVPVRVHVIYFCFLLIYSGVEFSLSFLLHNATKATTRRQAMNYVWIGTVMIVVQGGYIRRTKRPSASIAMQGIIALFMACVLLTVYAMHHHQHTDGFVNDQIAEEEKDTYGFLFLMGLTALGFASATVVSALTSHALTLATASTSSSSVVDVSGRVTGALRSAGHLARSVGPVVSCCLFATFGPLNYLIVAAACALLLLVASRSSLAAAAAQRVAIDEKAKKEQ